MFDDIYIIQLRKKSEIILDKMGKGESLSNEEQNTLILYGLNNHYHELEGKLLTEIKNGVDEARKFRIDMEKRFEQSRNDMNARFEHVDKRFERIYIFLYWIFGTILAALGIGFSAIGFLK